MRKTRRVLAIALVTAALCADRAAIAAPAAVSMPMARIAVKLANRLTVHLRQGTVVTIILLTAPRFAFQSDARLKPSDSSTVAPSRVSLSPFQFRLPPPVL
jgi:hypothetical protein